MILKFQIRFLLMGGIVLKDKEEFRTGIVTVDEKSLNFYMENYKFTFMDSENLSDIIFSDTICISPNSFGFIEGKLHKGNDIAISAGNIKVPVQGAGGLRTSMYIVYTTRVPKENQYTFYSIRFVGGTLKKLFLCNALKMSHMEDSTLSVEVKDDMKSYTFEMADCKCEMTITSDVNRSFGVDGTLISNSDVIMELKFSEEQTMDDFFSYISKIKDLLSIMSFRSNVGFDEIYLIHDREGNMESQIFIKKETEYTEKDIYRNISFMDLDDKVSNLLSIIFNSETEKPSYEIGFIPDSDKSAYTITNTKVRLICSALECEGALADNSKDTESAEIDNLKEEIKKIIRSYKEKGQISQKTHDNICGSMRYWSKSTSDMILSLYLIHKEEVDVLDKFKIISEDNINKFVKYRNQITHGTYKILDTKIATIAYVLSGLVYCCLLNRIGMSKDEIHRLCEYGKLLQ